MAKLHFQSSNAALERGHKGRVASEELERRMKQASVLAALREKYTDKEWTQHLKTIGLSHSSAQTYLRVYKRFGKSDILMEKLTNLNLPFWVIDSLSGSKFSIEDVCEFLDRVPKNASGRECQAVLDKMKEPIPAKEEISQDDLEIVPNNIILDLRSMAHKALEIAEFLELSQRSTSLSSR